MVTHCTGNEKQAISDAISPVASVPTASPKPQMTTASFLRRRKDAVREKAAAIPQPPKHVNAAQRILTKQAMARMVPIRAGNNDSDKQTISAANSPVVASVPIASQNLQVTASYLQHTKEAVRGHAIANNHSHNNFNYAQRIVTKQAMVRMIGNPAGNDEPIISPSQSSVASERAPNQNPPTTASLLQQRKDAVRGVAAATRAEAWRQQRQAHEHAPTYGTEATAAAVSVTTSPEEIRREASDEGVNANTTSNTITSVHIHPHTSPEEGDYDDLNDTRVVDPAVALPAELFDTDEMRLEAMNTALQELISDAPIAVVVPNEEENVSVLVDDNNEDVKRLKRQRRRMLLCFVAVVVVVAALLGGALPRQSRGIEPVMLVSTATTTPTATAAPSLSRTTTTTTAAPSSQVVYRPFLTKQDLVDAVDSYVLGAYASSPLAEQYGFPIDDWNVSLITDFSEIFSGLRNLAIGSFQVDLGRWDTSRATDMNSMFQYAQNFSSDLSAWDTSRVTKMNFMFQGAISFTSDLSRWDTRSVTGMDHMFDDATRFNSNLSAWDTSRVTRMNGMFAGAQNFSGDLSRWNTSNVVEMTSMFEGATRFNSNLSQWDTSKVVYMSSMFHHAESFSSDLSRWNTSQVMHMDYMFAGAVHFSSDLSAWDTSRVFFMDDMFNDSQNFLSDLSRWNTSQVTDMNYMFAGATIFNSNLSAWDTSMVTDMSHMFAGAQSFSSNLSQWNVSLVLDFSEMFSGATLFSSNLCSWEMQEANVKNMFLHSSCPNTTDPDLVKRTPFCFSCNP